MKKAIAWVGCQVTFWLGHGISRIYNNRWLAWLYPVYNRLMIWSLDINDWGGLKIWKETEHQESE
jgi:hypothetical protein